MALIDVTNVGSGTFKALRKVDRKMLDATQPNWLSLAPSSSVVHFMYEPTEPRVFFLYQPPTEGLAVDIVVSAYPADVATPTGRPYSTVSGNIALPDVWANTLYSYIMFRAYNKDAEFGGNAQLAMTHYQQFKVGMGEQLQSSTAVAPKE